MNQFSERYKTFSNSDLLRVIENKSDFFLNILKSVFILLFFATTSVFAQNSDSAEKPKNAVTFNLVSCFNVLNPSLQIGYQRNLTDDLIFQVEGGLLLKNSMNILLLGGTWIPNGKNFSYSGYLVQMEMKKMFKERGKYAVTRFFLGGEFQYLRNRGIVNNIFVSQWGDTYEDFFTEIKNRFRIAPKFGIQLLLGKHFLTEASAGLGIAYYHVEHIGRFNPNDRAYSSLYGYILKEGNFIKPNLLFSVKLGYKF